VTAAKASIRLTTTGRRSGKPRDVTLYGFDDDDRLVVVGSLGGAARDPAWAHNLRAHPRASVRRGKTESQVHAREVTDPDERARLWDLVTGAFPLYAQYQRKTTRTIPLFVLEASDGRSPSERRDPAASRAAGGEAARAKDP
jgi:deazaflavin-dependent oxidoreductase (nitroreductase family)